MADKKTYPDNKKRPFWQRKKEDPAEFEEVYAGPDFFEGRGKPTGDPEDAPEPSMIEAVYAGPEFFEREPEEPDLPEQEPPSAPAPEEDRVVPPPPPPPPMMCVYAGPDYFSGKKPVGVFVPVTPRDENKKTCPSCGTPAEKNAKFCTECGTKL